MKFTDLMLYGMRFIFSPLAYNGVVTTNGSDSNHHPKENKVKVLDENNARFADQTGNISTSANGCRIIGYC